MKTATLNYYLDTEFIECAKQRTVLGIPIGRPVDTIDLISLALVCEDGRTLYVLNAECELAYAWASEFVREKVLRAIYCEKVPEAKRPYLPFTLATLRAIFKRDGLTRPQLAFALLRFCYPGSYEEWREGTDAYMEAALAGHLVGPHPLFWAYYADYDWVAFCWVFGRMVDLPKTFPYYCRDLQQECDRVNLPEGCRPGLDANQEHSALYDAQWNCRLHIALQGYDASYSPMLNARLAHIRDQQAQVATPNPTTSKQAGA